MRVCDFLKKRKSKLIIFWSLVFAIFLFFNFTFAKQIPVSEGQVYVCPLATKMEEINPKCSCRIDLILWETVRSTCKENGENYEMTLTIQEYEGNFYYAILGFVNGGAGVNLPPVGNTGGPYEAFVGEKILFDASNSSDPNGDPLDFLWKFEDGKILFGEKVSHSFDSPGNYLLILEVSDGLASSTPTTTVKIKERPTKGIVLIPSQAKDGQKEGVVEKEKEEIGEEKESKKEQTKFLGPPTSEIFLKIPTEPKSEKEEIKEKKEVEKEKKEEKIETKKENLLASLVGVINIKNLVYFVTFVALVSLFFIIPKIKNYFLKKKKL